MSIRENLGRVRERVERACQKAGRSSEEVTIVAISKTFGVAAIREAYEAGLRDIGENRVQEAEPKIRELAVQGIRPTWHMVGHLQTNKVKTALDIFDIIHSVDSLRLAEALNRHAARPFPVLLEVNVAGEASKFGFSLEGVPSVVEAMCRLPNLDVQGLMTVAPLVADPEEVRWVFRQLRGLRDSLGLRHLSMGMTDDFEVAIEEGATLVRIGRAIFGER